MNACLCVSEQYPSRQKIGIALSSGNLKKKIIDKNHLSSTILQEKNINFTYFYIIREYKNTLVYSCGNNFKQIFFVLFGLLGQCSLPQETKGKGH